MMHINMNGGSGSININGMSIDVRGGRVYVNGKQYGPVDGSPVPAAEPAGAVLELDRDGRVVGDIHGDLTIRGSNITVVIEGGVDGSVACDGNLTCGKVGGSATAGGDIRTEKVGGSATAGGDIHSAKIGGPAMAGGSVRR